MFLFFNKELHPYKCTYQKNYNISEKSSSKYIIYIYLDPH